MLDWWVPVEAKHKLGFSSRIIMTPTARAIISEETGLLDAESLRPLLQHLWKKTAEEWWPSVQRQDWLLRSSTVAHVATRELYYKLHEEDEHGGWAVPASPL